MALVQTAKCDNPECDSTAEPSNIGGENEGYLPPEGWLWVDYQLIDSDDDEAPEGTVEVCSVDCLGPAVEAAMSSTEDPQDPPADPDDDPDDDEDPVDQLALTNRESDQRSRQKVSGRR